MTVNAIFYGQFINNAAGATGLTVTFDLFQITRSTNASSKIVTAGSATEVGDGLYLYRYATADLSTYDYAGVFITSGTADQKNIPALWSSFSQDNTAAIAAIPTTSAPTAAAIRSEMDSNSTKLANLDVTISSRNAIAPDNASITAIKAKTDNLPSDPASNTQVNTRLATSGYTAAPTAVAVRQEMDANSIKLALLDVAVSSRSATGENAAQLSAIKTQTDKIPSDPATNTQVNTRLAAGSFVVPPTVTDIVDAVWDEPTSGHNVSGTTGSQLTLAGSAAGGGPIRWVYNLTNENTHLPIAQAYVWATTDVAGLNIVGQGLTDNFGNVTFYLSAGTYYMQRAKSGYIFNNPDAEVVS